MVLWLKGVNGLVLVINSWLAGCLFLNPSLLPIVCVACACKALLVHVVQHRYESSVFPLQGMPRLFFTLDQKLCLT